MSNSRTEFRNDSDRTCCENASRISPFLLHRALEAELMDMPDLDRVVHGRALRGLARLNWLSGSDRILWRPIRALAKAFPGQTLRVLDLASGGGDVLIRLWRRARRAGVNLAIHGGDISPTAVTHARANAERAGANVTFFELNVNQDHLPTGFDVITSSLFIHHLSTDAANELLQKMRAAAGKMVLINDLLRSRMGFVLAWLSSRLFTRSPVVRVDAPRSVEAAFSLEEVRTLARDAGLDGAELSRHWPCRFLLSWRRA